MDNVLEKLKFWKDQDEDWDDNRYDNLQRQLELIENHMEQIEKEWKQAIRNGKNTVLYFNCMRKYLREQRKIMIELNKIDDMYGLSAEEMTPVDVKIEEVGNLIESEVKLELLDDSLSKVKDNNLYDYLSGDWSPKWKEELPDEISLYDGNKD